MAFDTWESYFYPAPDNATLRNLLDERDRDALQAKEYGRAGVRGRELLSGQVAIPRTYDAAHVRAIHRHLFQDVYEWAGEFRTVNMSKRLGTGFGDVRTGEVDQLLASVRDRVARTNWGVLDRDEFSEKAAEVFAYLNYAHPFREGNGRTSRVFMEHVAEQSRFTLEFPRVSPEVWNQRSMLSGPDVGSSEPQPGTLVPVFHAMAVDRPPSPSASAEDLVQDPTRDRSAYRASFPGPATDVARPGRATGAIKRPPERPGQRYDVGRD